MALPAFDVVQDDQLVEVAGEFVVHPVDGLELLSDAADGVVERHVDAVVVEPRELPS